MKTLPVAVQVYSVRDFAQNDFPGTLRKIKEMGYDGVELAGLYGLSAKEVRAALNEAGLPAISAHVPYAELREDTAGTVAKYAEIGCRFIAIPYLAEEDRVESPAYPETEKNIYKIAAECKKYGITLLYHNHNFEFTAKVPDGRYALDYMYETIPADVLQTELDTCWVKVGGEEPVKYIDKYAGRAPVVHLKDFYKEGMPVNMFELIGTSVKKEEQHEPGFFEFRPVGSGMQDFPPILEASVRAGAEWVVVEQDSSNGRTSLEAIKMSRDYLKSLGW